MSDLEKVENNVHMTHAEIVLNLLGLKKNDPAAITLVALAERYHLDPLLKHIVLIPQRDKFTKQIKEYKAYVTRDGLLHVAHRSGKFSGIVLEELTENETYYIAWVSVYRKDFEHPVRYRGKYPKHPKNAPHMEPYAEEMAIKCAESMALRRAFDVAAPIYEEIYELHEDPTVVASVNASEVPLDAGSAPKAIEATETSVSAVESVGESEEPPKRRRGRPRKTEVTTSVVTSSQSQQQPPKRKRGRPRKSEIVEQESAPVEAEAEPEAEPKPEPEPEVESPSTGNGEVPPRVGLVAYFNETPVQIRPVLLAAMHEEGYKGFADLDDDAVDRINQIFKETYDPVDYRSHVSRLYGLVLDDVPNDPIELGLRVWEAGYGR